VLHAEGSVVVFDRPAYWEATGGEHVDRLKELFGSLTHAIETLDAIIRFEINRCEPGYAVEFPCCDPGDSPARSGKPYGSVGGLTDNDHWVVTQHRYRATLQINRDYDCAFFACAMGVIGHVPITCEKDRLCLGNFGEGEDR
jgi:hypothetical protein